MSSIVQRHLSNDERRIMDLALRRSVTILEDPRDAEILRLRAQVAALLKVKEALEDWSTYPCPTCGGDCASANPPVYRCPPRLAHEALTAYSEWEKTNADK